MGTNGICSYSSSSIFWILVKHYPNLKYIPSDYHSDTPHSPEEMNNSYHYFVFKHKTNNSLHQKIKVFFIEHHKSVMMFWLDTSIRLNHTGYHIYQG